MKFSINAGDFSRALKIALTAVGGGGSTLPIVGHVLLSVGDNDERLRLTGTNIEWWAEASAPLVEYLRPGAITLPARNLAALVGSYPADAVIDVTYEEGENKACIEAGFNQSEMLGLPAEEFPLAPLPDNPTAEFALPPALFAALVKSTSYAAATDQSRPIITSLLFALRRPFIPCGHETVLSVTATDTHRLVYRQAPVRQTKNADSDMGGTWMVPTAVAVNLMRLIGGDTSDLVFTCSDSFMRVQSASATFTTRLIEGQYPNYERVIPTHFDSHFVVERDSLITTLRRIILFSGDNDNRAVFDTNGHKVTLSGESGTVGQTKETLEIAREGSDIKIAINAKFLLDALGGETSEGVRFDYTEPLRPAKLTASGDDEKSGVQGLQILMPMQII